MSIMKKYSDEIDVFLKEFILPKMNLIEYNDENIGDIVDYISSEFETPLANAEECGEILSEDEKRILDLSTKAVTEITTRDDWK